MQLHPSVAAATRALYQSTHAQPEWLFLDGREVHTDWMAKESPFIYAVYTKK